MKPRYYIHMGPKSAEKVSCMWKAVHITIFFLLLCSSSVATLCVYNILDMYKFNCIIYAKASFEQTYEERLKQLENETVLVEKDADLVEGGNDANNLEEFVEIREQFKPDCVKDKQCKSGVKRNDQGLIQRMQDVADNATVVVEQVWRVHPGHIINETMDQSLQLSTNHVNNTGFLNMRKTVFASIYMCNLMLFSPLASMIMSIFLGAFLAIGGKGGAGNPGDLLPNPWICVYPFLGLCAFMMIFSFISDNLFHKGLGAFCSRYYPITKSYRCSESMDRFNVQFSLDKKGPPKPFYTNYFVGSVGMQVTSALWVIQAIVYVFRILCLADFSVFLTRIRIKEDQKGQDSRLAKIVLKVVDPKTKVR